MPYNSNASKPKPKPKKKKRSLISYMKRKAQGKLKTSIYMDPTKREYLRKVGK